MPIWDTVMPARTERRSDAGTGKQSLLMAAHDLDTGYGAVQVLWNFNIEVNTGEVVALVGSNGAGKTTLLRALSGVLKPWRGTVTFDGHSMVGLGSHEFVRAGISHVPEGRRLFSGLTVETNLTMGAFTRSSRTEILESLERVYSLFPGLAERRRQLAGTLSGGEQQMAAIGRGLMARPKLLLIDELSLGLAPVIVDRVVEVIESIKETEALAILLVDQDVQVAFALADRGYVMEMGRVVASGPASRLAVDERVKEAYLGL